MQYFLTLLHGVWSVVFVETNRLPSGESGILLPARHKNVVLKSGRQVRVHSVGLGTGLSTLSLD